MRATPTSTTTRAPRPLRATALAASLAIALAALPAALAAQVSGSLVVPNASPYLSRWQSDPTVALLTLTNTTGQDLPVTASVARILRGQQTVATVPGSITTLPGTPATSFFRTPQIARWSAATIAADAPASLRDRRVLPEGSYTLCVELTGQQATLGTFCAPFTISLAAPPRLVAPLDRTNIVTRFPVLQWTPAVSARTPTVSYALRLVEIYGGQVPTRALEANRPIVETILTNETAFQYPLAAYPLQPGRCYAWRVQARAGQGGPNGSVGAPIGRNEGRSEVFTFCFRPPADRLDSLRPRPDTSIRDSVGRAVPDSARVAARGASWRVAHETYGARAFAHASSRHRYADSAGAAPAFTGSAVVYGEAYDMSGEGTAARPGDTERLRMTGTLAGGGWTAPMEVLLASDERGNRQRISQARISPTFRTLTLHAGTLVPQLSEYSLYDATLLGGGMELAPVRPMRGARASLWLGESQRAVRPTDPTLVPQFARTLGAASAGIGSFERANLYADALWASDRRGSLGALGDTTGAATPQRNIVLGLRGQLPVWGDRVLASAAASRSVYRPDVRSRDVDDITDDAGHLSVAYRRPAWSVGTTVAYVGANYVSLGNTQLVTDRVDYQVAGAFQHRLFTGSATAGLRRNNVDDALDATTRTRGIYSFSLGWTPSTVWGVDLSASNTVIDARGNDTLFSRNGSTLVSVTPRFGWRTGSMSHQLVVSGAYQESSNEAYVDPQPADVASTTGTLAYALSFDGGLGLDLSAMQTRTETGGLDNTVLALTPGIGWALRVPGIPQPFQTRAALQWTEAEASGATEREVLPILQLGYGIASGHTIALDLRRRQFRPGGTGGRFQETTAVLEYTRPF